MTTSNTKRPDDLAERVSGLRALLRAASRAYYVDNEPTMSDSEFDRLLAELDELERAHPGLDDPESPTHRVGGEPLQGFENVAHAKRMLSIENTYSNAAVVAWDARVVKGLDGERPVYLCDPKIDGVAISLRYEQGRLVAAVTRGDGERGDLVTANVRAIGAVPLMLDGDAPAVLEVRGEVVMPNASFDRINAEREAAGEPLFANARNAAAGTLKSLDSRVVRARGLHFSAHGCGVTEGLDDSDSHSAFLQRLRGFGLPVPTSTRRCDSIEAVLEAIDDFATMRHEMPFGIDGLVIRVDRFDLQERLGETAKAPRWCIAFKYPAEQATTKLLSVNWQVGKGGTLTPRATMEPVFVAGSTISHATLHNIEEIRRKDIRVGDSVVVEKAGEIIPQVIEPLLDARDGSEEVIEPPACCPSCESAVEQEGPKLFCVNAECPGQFRERLKWFVGRGQMDVDGLGEKLVDQLLDAALVSHYADLFSLKREDLLALERMGETSADNLLRGLEVAKDRGLARVLAGLGIRHIGTSAAKTLARSFADADALQSASEDDIAALPDFGDITAGELHRWLASAPARETFARLAAAGVSLLGTVVAEDDDDEDNMFVGQTIVITGTLEQFDRRELGEQLEGLGAKVSGSISKNTDLLIAGAKAGSKLAKAEKLGVMVIDEAELIRRLSSKA